MTAAAVDPLEARLTELAAGLRRWTAGGRRYFNLLSTGRTATHWIARAISRHPRAFCAHGPELQPFRTDESEDEKSMRHHRDGERVAAMTIDAYFDLLETRDFEVYGAIHGIGINQDEWPYRRRDYYVASVTREPVARLNSFVARWGYEIQRMPGRRAQLAPWLASQRISVAAQGMALPPAGEATTDADELFVVAAWWMASNEPLSLGVPFFRCEDITADRASYSRFFTTITAGRLEGDDAYLDAVMAMPKLDQRAVTGGEPEALFRAWAPWRQQLFTEVIDFYDLRRFYTDLGYRLPAPVSVPARSQA